MRRGCVVRASIVSLPACSAARHAGRSSCLELSLTYLCNPSGSKVRSATPRSRPQLVCLSVAEPVCARVRRHTVVREGLITIVWDGVDDGLTPCDDGGARWPRFGEARRRCRPRASSPPTPRRVDGGARGRPRMLRPRVRRPGLLRRRRPAAHDERISPGRRDDVPVLGRPKPRGGPKSPVRVSGALSRIA